MVINRIGAVLALVTLLLASVGFHQHMARLAERATVDVAIESLPLELGQWQGKVTQGLDVRSQEILRLTRFVKRAYSRGDERIELYIGYWQHQTGDYQAAKHSPLLCLPANGWEVERRGSRELEDVGSTEGISVKRLVGEVRGKPYLFYYWFFTGERSYSEEWQALFRISLQNLLASRSDGGIVEVSTPLPTGYSREEAIAHASEQIEDFLAELRPALEHLVAEAAQ
ncbi:MAG: EpsI family protein [Bdellovibrionales bacterium]|nr:EpsI family protein [Bdellovibrionales bacterium]